MAIYRDDGLIIVDNYSTRKGDIPLGTDVNMNV